MPGAKTCPSQQLLLQLCSEPTPSEKEPHQNPWAMTHPSSCLDFLFAVFQIHRVVIQGVEAVGEMMEFR